MNADIRYSSKEHTCLCFKHATQLAMQDIDIEVEVEVQDDDHDSSYDMRSHVCSLCQQEYTK